MSEGSPPDPDQVWIEKYRPHSLEDIVGQDRIIERMKGYVEQGEIPHLLLSGPAGTGKCITGETPILTNAGVEPIQDVVGDIEGFAQPRKGLEVATYTESGEFAFVEPEAVFSKPADSIVTVKTRDGGRLSVTPEHPFLVIDEDGLQWREAGKLEPEDRIARPFETPTPTVTEELDWISAVDGNRFIATVNERFASQHGLPTVSSAPGLEGDDQPTSSNGKPNGAPVPEDREIDTSASSPDTEVQVVSVKDLTTLDVPQSELKDYVHTIAYLGGNDQPTQPITPPWSVSPELAEFIGWIVSEARIDAGRIRFYNTETRIIERFERLAESLFGVETERMERKGVPFVRIISASLTKFLEAYFGVVSGNKIGTALLQASVETRASFLRTVFDAEGYVSKKGVVELTQKDPDIITLLTYLLASLGIPCRRKREQKAATNGTGIKRTYHTLSISGACQLSRFQDRIGFTFDEKAARLADAADRRSNPNHDTIPTQRVVDDLCDTLALKKSEHIPSSLNPDNPGRRRYLEGVNSLLSAAVDRVESAHQVKELVPPDLESVVATPATWVEERKHLRPIDTRNAVSAAVSPRADRLLEYADGRRTPYAGRVQKILAELNGRDPGDITTLQKTLDETIDLLGVSDNRIARGTQLWGTDVRNLLENQDHDLSSLSRFGTVADRIRQVADAMQSREVLSALSMLDALAAESLYFDEVSAVDTTESDERVYDITVPESHNYVAGTMPTVMHNTASAQAIARELYGEDWQENFLELNASDDRGIDVVRERIKEFARASFGGYDHRMIFLDEADALTSDAQSALRRTMEQFSNNVRFVLSCNYSSQIIDPIQSRCAVFRFSSLPDEAVAEVVRKIADSEGIEITDEAVEALVYAAAGDMRKAINGLQAASVTGGTVEEEMVYDITATARPEEVQSMVEAALDGEFAAARAQLDELLTDKGLAGGDVIDQLHRSVWEFDLSEEAAVQLMDRIGEADYRIAEGANERVQLEALLAAVALRETEVADG